MIVEFPFGKEKISVDLPDSTVVLKSKANDYVPALSEEELVHEAFNHPINSPKLSLLAKDKKDIVIITSDYTRPIPSKITLPIYLAEIRKYNPNCNITILIATGLHRPTTREEMIAKFGKDLVENERIINHTPRDYDNLKYLGKLHSGGDLLINKIAAEADLLVSEGFIEPHFFAGFSGGRKSVLPGISSEKTILSNHFAEYMASENARTGNFDGNPIHRDMKYAAQQANLRFILNVVLDADKKIIAAFAGDAFDAHEKGCEFVRELSSVDGTAADIVITTNGGFPLDQNIYQSAKSLVAGKCCCNKDGIIIEVSKCNEGHGAEEFYQTFKKAKNAKEVADDILKVKMEDTVPEQWGSQIMAMVLGTHEVFYVTDPATEQILKDMHIQYYPSIQEALAEALKRKGKNASITAIPEGTSVIVRPVE